VQAVGIRPGAATTLMLGVCWMAAPLGAHAQAVHELTIATPNVISVEVRDPPFVPGKIVPLPQASSAAQGTWIRTAGGLGMVIGPRRGHVRLTDTPPSAFLDRSRIDDADAYGEIAGRKVTAIYRKSVPYDSGIYPGPNGDTRSGASLKHTIYLQLSGPLPEGKHVVHWPAGALPPTTFDYAERETRAMAIRVNQNGYGPDDPAKIAYLSLWLPGGPAEGAVDFRTFGLSAFHILDETGSIAFSGEMSLRASPTSPEPGNGFKTPLLEYPSGAQPGMAVERLSAGPPVTVLAPKHGLATGQRIWLDGFAGTMKAFNGFATVGDVVNGDVFRLLEPPSGNPAPGSGGPPRIHPVHTANRAGTFVFQIDFSAWRPSAEGVYRIHIPGLGVSDPFDVRADVWLRAGRLSMGGLYNHRSGIALDGRFGFTRPVAFRPGPDVSVRLSQLPLIWSSNFSDGVISADLGGAPPWLTPDVAPDTYWGGYMDAGDWDRRIEHVDVAYLLLDVYESFPDVLRTTSLGTPKSSEFLDRDLYADTDDLADILHEAIWTLDFFRRLQMPDGSIRGGIESAGHPLMGTPSYLEHLTIFAYAPDHISSYRYAGGAAKLAGILEREGKARLAAIYKRSALEAWRAAERINGNPEAFYGAARSIAERTGALGGASWDERAARLRQVGEEYRVAAAGGLYRLTGEDEFHAIFKAAWARPVELYRHTADGAWEYYLARHATADRALQARIAAKFRTSAGMIAEAQAGFTYASMKHPYAPIGWGQALAPDYNQAQLVMRAHQIGKDGALLGTMQAASAHILGANQVSLSFTTGLGRRNIKHPLHVDHLSMGVKAPDGITSYGWAPQSDTAHEWIFGPAWSPLPVSGTAENAANRMIFPNRFVMPFYEYLIEHPVVIMQQEYTVQQTIGTTAGMWLYLHAARAAERGRQ
jgi:endoglucanase